MRYLESSSLTVADLKLESKPPDSEFVRIFPQRINIAIENG